MPGTFTAGSVLATEIIAVSVGPAKAQETLRTALAMGADRAVLVTSEDEVEPLAVAKIIAFGHFLPDGMHDVQINQLASAGWLGLLVTSVNLIPLGQLDGGHILYALIGDRQHAVGRLMWLVLIPLGYWFWGWWAWAGLILLLSRGRVAHPSVLDRYRPIPPSRRWLGWATVLLFAVTFTPVPF